MAYDQANHLSGGYGNNGVRQQAHLRLGDLPVAMVAGGGIFPVLSDHLGTPSRLSSAKQVRWQWDNLDPFGANAPNTNPVNLGVFNYNLRFPGQYVDGESGLFYNYYRTYDPKAGRYTQSDPIGLDGGMNTYGYVGGNPLVFVDPTGEVPVVGPIVYQCAKSPIKCAVILKRVWNGCRWVWEEVTTINGGKPGNYTPNRTLPRTKNGEPMPDENVPHTQLGRSPQKYGQEPQAREWMYDKSGKLVPKRDIDFTDHNFPNDHTDPHQHTLTPNNPQLAPKGGYERGDPEPLQYP